MYDRLQASFLGGSLYFAMKHTSTVSPTPSSIIIFDVNSEKFREIRYPSIPSGVDYYYGSLVVIKGCIYLCLAYNDIVCERVGELFVESNAGLSRMDGDTWTKVATFSPGQSDELLSISHICETKNGEWIVMLVDNSFHEIGLKEFATKYMCLYAI